jgi:di/tricarboxylate transporter
MLGYELPVGAQPIVALVILAAMLVLFVRETYPVEVTAIGGAGVMLILGILPQAELVKSLSNAAPWTIACMFIIAGALVRTGALGWATNLALKFVERSPRKGLGSISVGVTSMSAFMNNTPLVVVMIPVFMRLARALKVSPSKLMIPLSYLTILGGTMTLIGTSTNLVVDGVAKEQGLAHFGIFEITPLGICCAVIGLIYLGLFRTGCCQSATAWQPC